MIATEVPARTIALLVSACRCAEEFFCKGSRAEAEQRARDRKNATLAQQAAIQLRIALENPTDVSSFNEVAALIVNAPGVDSCIIQHTVALDKDIADKQAGAIVYSHTVREEFRLFIHTGKAHAEATGPELGPVIGQVFAKLKLAVPLDLRPWDHKS